MVWTRLKKVTNAAVMPPRSHFDKLIEDGQRSIIEALLKSAAQGDMARSAYLAGKHGGLQEALALQRQAARTDVDPDGDI